MSSIPSHGRRRGLRRPLAATATAAALGLGAGLAVLSGAAIAGYNIWTGEYTFTKQELQRAVEGRFPATLRYAQVLDVRLTRPRLTLDAAGNRITTQVDAQLTNSLLPAPPINGTLALNSGLRYDPVKRAVLLDNPTVEQVHVDGVPGQYSAQLNAVGNLVAQELLKDYPLHTFKPEELQVNGKQVEPGAITVTEDGIAVKIDTK
ncbi:DUF1439 domain-containing protein [Cupriavidus gilardii]|uniref:DUF1439 domain-containing protein n=1 Tax=Cupriavidus gilardii TaxID=82541 RepID=A0A849BA17_9BURK|nr:DUF1439 domain-containing protein [Cupriavidus gilardii]KAB0597868.1 DUF1439 domain-containing protein [Cupriavidus gilardii]MCT9015467.1 DUF1439 domain-containing protein [Cupriavidus gilardii]MCT9055237.1 DUF1439 domain-containing protein [Cupriavidus gilardii]NNH10595.1 DUF1439 domain-containing protein [Cupriavidus gilardii]WNG71818.1 DUF1439 domain-containing protein [Cupriavidus gilardii]